ncbi:MAG: hypothetical protein ABEH47_06985 [Haloferacaceae archaeon]
MVSARLHDTHAVALRHGSADVPVDTTLVGVVRRPTRWFAPVVDENRRALGPPAPVLDEFERRCKRLKMRGLCEVAAHNAAWDELDVATRYRDHLATDDAARAALADLRDRLRAGESLALVCYEDTAAKRCYRTLLREALSERLD